MTEHKKLVARHAHHQTSRVEDSAGLTARLPDDLIAAQARRFELFTGIGAGLWTLVLVMDAFLLPATVGVVVSRSTLVVEACGALISFALFLYIRYAQCTPQSKTDFSLWYMLTNAAAIAVLNTVIRPPTADSMGHLSWVTIVILVSSMVMPSAPRKILIASLVAASMDPLGVWIAHLRGLPVPSVAGTIAFH